MRFAVRICVVLVVGIALGLLATWLTVRDAAMPGGISNGAWHTNLSIGSTQSDPYTRARTALHGLFALNRRETLYYTAWTDDHGQPLDGRCRYDIVGRDPDARWWSITAYGPDEFLIANPVHRYSVSRADVERARDGTFDIVVAQNAAGANWIPVKTGPFTLTLRLYNPGSVVATVPADAGLPTVKRGGCR